MSFSAVVNANKEFERANRELINGNVLGALSCLEKALQLNDNRSWYSFLGFCIAKERGYMNRGLELCRTAIEAEPENGWHYYFLARIHLVAKNKPEAIKVLRKGLSCGERPEIVALLDQLGSRKPPVFKGLKRDNPLNKFTGLLLSRLKLR
jgi:tetratricopeptide (TPR) repeat protein